MQRFSSFVVLIVGAAVATAADAAMINFYAASPMAINGATSCAAASALGVNPVLPPGPGNWAIDLCMEIDPTLMGVFGGTGTRGGQLNITGSPGTFGVSSLTVNNSLGRWPSSSPGLPGPATNVFTGLSFVSSAVVSSASPSDYTGAFGPGFLIASGSFGGSAGAALYLAIPPNAGINSDDPLGTAGGAFGWALGGAPNIAATDLGLSSPQPFYSSFAGAPAVPAHGFVLDDLNGGGVISLTGEQLDPRGPNVIGTLPIIQVSPEPATLTLLALAALAAVRPGHRRAKS